MPIARPKLLCLGGANAFAAYRAAFENLYCSTDITDYLGRLVEFPADSAKHVCYIKPGNNPNANVKRTVWKQDRAERIPWIIRALQQPDAIRTDKEFPAHEIYLVTIEADVLGHSTEHYGVIVKPSFTRRKAVEFITGFIMEEKYFHDKCTTGKPIYPLPPKKRR